MKTLTHVRRRAPKLWVWTSKIMPNLQLLYLFCPIKNKFHTPPYYPGTMRAGTRGAGNKNMCYSGISAIQEHMLLRNKGGRKQEHLLLRNICYPGTMGAGNKNMCYSETRGAGNKNMFYSGTSATQEHLLLRNICYPGTSATQEHLLPRNICYPETRGAGNRNICYSENLIPRNNWVGNKNMGYSGTRGEGNKNMCYSGTSATQEQWGKGTRTCATQELLLLRNNGGREQEHVLLRYLCYPGTMGVGNKNMCYSGTSATQKLGGQETGTFASQEHLLLKNIWVENRNICY